MASEFSFQELISRRASAAGLNLNLKKARLLRHDTVGRKIWNLDCAGFAHWVSFQRPGTQSPYNACELAFQFVPAHLPAGRAGALFVAAHQVTHRWVYEGIDAKRQPLCFIPGFSEQHESFRPGYEAVDLVHLDAFDEFSERILIEWSTTAHGTRAWSQWWKKEKPIVEMRVAPMEAPFPGLQNFQCPINELELIPSSWREVLSAVSGIYLLVCQDTGQQYVGSAQGENGLYGRWLNYAHTGHGGNSLLKARKKHDYVVTILEVCSSTMTTSEIIHREQRWKDKLGSRAFGLNAN
jgi:hypothetical protein